MKKPGEMRMGLGEREAVVDLGRPLDGVLRPSAGNHEYRLVKRRGQHNGSPSSVVGVGLVRKTSLIVARNEADRPVQSLSRRKLARSDIPRQLSNRRLHAAGSRPNSVDEFQFERSVASTDRTNLVWLVRRGVHDPSSGGSRPELGPIPGFGCPPQNPRALKRHDLTGFARGARGLISVICANRAD